MPGWFLALSRQSRGRVFRSLSVHHSSRPLLVGSSNGHIPPARSPAVAATGGRQSPAVGGSTTGMLSPGPHAAGGSATMSSTTLTAIAGMVSGRVGSPASSIPHYCESQTAAREGTPAARTSATVRLHDHPLGGGHDQYHRCGTATGHRQETIAMETAQSIEDPARPQKS